MGEHGFWDDWGMGWGYRWDDPRPDSDLTPSAHRRYTHHRESKAVRKSKRKASASSRRRNR